MWNLVGTPSQNALVQQAIDRCDFDFTKCLPSLAREGKSSVRVEWADLSRYGNREARHRAGSGRPEQPHSHKFADTGHEHVHDGDAVAHPIEREVEGRMRVLGLFYLPPYTKIVLDLGLERDPILAQEVFLAEGAHCADYHLLTPEGRRRFINALHTEQLPPGADVSDGAAHRLDGHTCSWFDVGGYADWTGESWMQGFVEGTSDVPCTIELNHPVGPEDRAVVREILGIVDAPVTGRVYAKKSGKVVHDSHDGIEPARWWDSLSAAAADGMRPCKTCKP